MDSKIPSTFLLPMESPVSRLLDIKLSINVYFCFIPKEKIELWVLTSNTNTFALFDDTNESHLDLYCTLHHYVLTKKIIQYDFAMVIMDLTAGACR